MQQIERRANEILQQLGKTIISEKSLEFAIDLTYIPYHGEPKKDETEIVRSKAKSGTTHFHAYATLYVIVLGKRFTLALKYIKKGTSNLETISHFIDVIRSMDMQIKRLYMDKGFCEVEVINYLKQRDINAIIALPLKGKTVKSNLKGKSKIINYTMKSPTSKETATFDLAIVCKYSKNKYKRKGAKYFAYALVGTIIKPRNVFEDYRKRFGIESSYRIMNRSRARTSSQQENCRNTMNERDVFIRKTANYRIWVDEDGAGNVRILKRINFKTLVALFEELHGEIRKRASGNPGKVHIIFYVSRSLYDEMSVNAKEFLGFCSSCMGIKFKLVQMEIWGIETS